MWMCWLLVSTGGKKKKNGRYVFEIHAHTAGFLTHKNGCACSGKVCRLSMGEESLRQNLEEH